MRISSATIIMTTNSALSMLYFLAVDFVVGLQFCKKAPSLYPLI